MSQRDEVFEMLVERGAPLFGKSKEEMNEDMRFVEDLNAKSVHYSQITTFLEDKFDVEIPYMTFRRKKTIGEAVDYVCDLLEE
ncbi:MAG TPA: acyl carrier protein [Clostridiales bacterium]|nr:acyl carrier protein [Clostridiales bacterium]